MPASLTRPAETYSPIYFLASLGAGGITVTFFMYLMFWVPHPGRPVPVFEDVAAAFSTGASLLQGAIVIAMLGIAAFAFLNLKSLIWNLSALRDWRGSAAYDTLKSSNAEAGLLAMPLALAMTVNVLFIVGLVFVPGLWKIVEYLFPAAMVAFLAIATIAFRMIGAYLGRILSKPGAFDFAGHNSFAQLTPAFALAMVAVGLAAPAAMSTAPSTVALSLILSTIVSVIAVLYAIVAAVTAIVSILQNGSAREAGPTLMIFVPILTVLGILSLRQSHGMHTTFDAHAAPIETTVFLAQFLALQIAFLLLGALVMRRQGYFDDYVLGEKTSPVSYALVCPAVAFSVMLHFFVNKGLVGAGIVDKFDFVYWGVSGLALLTQFVSIALVLRLNRQHFRASPLAGVPAA